MAVIKLVIAFILSFSQIISPYFVFATKGVDSLFEDWSAEDVFTESYAVELEKTPGKDFVVLNFTDIQLDPLDFYGEDGEYTFELIAHEIEEIKPDLITLSGDNTSSITGYIKLVEYLDSFKIPWAPIMGNHDGENGSKIIEPWTAYTLANAEYCLFKFGPENMGYGNYIINITENGEIIHTLVMMDTHSEAEDTENGKINYGTDENGNEIIGEDHLWADQLKWYKWCIEGVESVAGKTVESTVIFHIPCNEYRTARDLMMEYETDENGNKIIDSDERTHLVFKEEYKDICFGSIYENICAPDGNNGFFALVKELGSTKNIIAGHDHTNDASFLYEGIRLNYALKSGHGSYWSSQANKNGSSILTINSDGHATFSHHYYEVTE